MNSIETYIFQSTHPIPPILRTNHEARAQGLKHYRVAFGVDFMEEPLKISAPARIYLNAYSDRVCFVGGVSSNSGQEIRRIIKAYKICHLAINVEEYNFPFRAGNRSLQRLNQGGGRLTTWLNGNVETITLYHYNKRMENSQHFSFINVDEEAIRHGKGLGIIRRPEVHPPQFEPNQQLCMAKDDLWYLRKRSLDRVKFGPLVKNEDVELAEAWAGAGVLKIKLTLLVLD